MKSEHRFMQYGFYFDNTRCTGCKTCEMACKDYKNLDATRTYRRIIDYENGTWELSGDTASVHGCFIYHVSISCNHCSNPACVHVCPTGAMHKDDLGLVWPDTTKCIGCGYCTMACPYHAPVIDQEIKKSSKCDGCKNRTTEGKAPICVDACPLRALDFGEMESLKEIHPDCASSILPLASESYTLPNLLIKVSLAAQQAQETGGHIANYDEI